MSIRARLVLAAFGVLLVSNTAWAQPGTFRWQQQPYCNVLTLYVVQEGGGNYTLDGTDDMCGAPQRASVRGLAHVNPDGTIGFGLVITSGGRSTTLNATITLASLGGAWADSHGDTGSFVFTPGAGVPGSPRPAPSSTVVKVTHSYDLAAGATSAPFTLPANVPIEIRGVQLAPGFRGIGYASLLSIAGSGGFIEWVGQHSESGLPQGAPQPSASMARPVLRSSISTGATASACRLRELLDRTRFRFTTRAPVPGTAISPSSTDAFAC